MSKPNILLIVTDQFRGDCLGAAGNPVVQTPTIDSIIRSGQYFTHARTELTSCVGARRSIESGQSPEKHKMIGYADSIPWKEENTFAKILSKEGYYTMNVGKRHNYPRVGSEGLAGYQHNAQYEEWRTLSDRFHDDYHQFLRNNEAWYYGPFATGASNNSFRGDIFPLEERLHPSSWVAAEGCKAIEKWNKEHHDKPFFMHLSFTAPHPPFTPPNRYYQEYISKKLPKPLFGDANRLTEKASYRGRFFQEADCIQQNEEQTQKTRAAYYGLIHHIDSCIHQVLFYINREFRNFKGPNVLNNTIVILTADHGEMLGDFNRFNKQVAYEGSVRIPFVINPSPSLSSGYLSGIKHSAAVCNQDLLPTVLSMANIKTPDSVTGEDLSPLLKGKNKSIKRELIHGEHYGFMHYLCNDEYKYIWNYHDSVEELYHIKNDPHESTNVMDDPIHQNKGKDFRAELIKRLEPRAELFLEKGQLVKPKMGLEKWLETQGQKADNQGSGF